MMVSGGGVISPPIPKKRGRGTRMLQKRKGSNEGGGRVCVLGPECPTQDAERRMVSQSRVSRRQAGTINRMDDRRGKKQAHKVNCVARRRAAEN